MTDLTLYTYWRSTAAYRVRIALALKGLSATMIPINLLKGEHLSGAFNATNPQHMLPVLEDDGVRLTQSLGILEYLEDVYPTPPLLPSDPVQAARVRAIAQAIACDIHPLNVPRVMKYMTEQFGISEEQKTAWMQHWIREGLRAVEALLDHSSKHPLCVGSTPTIAECCLIPQVYNAKRFGVELDEFRSISKIYSHCLTLQAFQSAAPEMQVDYIKNSAT